MNGPRILDEGLAALELDPTPVARERLWQYALLLQRWNRTYNLTAVHELDEIVAIHLLDSLAILPHVGKGTLLDVGSGAGLPGIPLAIVAPALAVTLAEANAKKVAFQRQAAIELGLANLTIHHGRIEEWSAGPAYSQIVSRAFAELREFVALTDHLLAPDGRWMAMKGVLAEDEIGRVPIAVQVKSAVRLSVPQVRGERHLVIMARREPSAEGSE